MGQSHQLPPVPSHSLVRALQCPQICWKFVHFGGAGCSVDPSGTCPPTSQSQHPWPGQVLSPRKGWLCPFQPPCSYLPSHSPQSSQRSFTPLLTVPRFLPIALRTKSNSLRWLQNFSCNVLFATPPPPHVIFPPQCFACGLCGSWFPVWSTVLLPLKLQLSARRSPPLEALTDLPTQAWPRGPARLPMGFRIAPTG